MAKLVTLKNSKDFQIIAKKGKSVNSKYLVLKYCDKSKIFQEHKTNEPIFAVTISRKMGKAVKRNFLKRRLKEIFRENIGLANLQNKVINFCTKRYSVNASFQDLKKEVDKILKSI